MLGKNIRCTRALKGCVVSFILLFFLSCTPATHNEQRPQSSQLQAENSMMKKRLPLMERESDVLKKENQQHRAKIQELETQNRQLAMDLANLQENHEIQMIVGTEQINSLQAALQKNGEENREAIATLRADKKTLEEKMLKESHAAHEQLVMQKAVAKQQREKLIKENDQKELELAGKLEAARKKLAAKELEIASLKSSIDEFSDKLEKANALSAEMSKARNASMAELESIKAATKKTRFEYLAQLESIETTNGQLNKKVAELSSDLSRKKQAVPMPSKAVNE